VAPRDPDNPNSPVGPMGFGPVPTAKLPFSSIVVASNDDRYIAEKQARLFADAWGSQFVLLTHAGHINAASGYGPWDEGYALLDSLRAGSA
jgi:predicted alpha/beta hydrolase family esterase